MEKEPSRFGRRDADANQKELIELKDSKSTKKQTKSSVKLFADFLCECKPPQFGANDPPPYTEIGQNIRREELLDLEIIDLNNLLTLFHGNVKKQDETSYKKNSFVGHRHGLARWFKMTDKVDIIDDPHFADDNQTFVAAKFELKKLGMAVVKHYEEITEEDLHKFYMSFDTSTPRAFRKRFCLTSYSIYAGEAKKTSLV